MQEGSGCRMLDTGYLMAGRPRLAAGALPEAGHAFFTFAAHPPRPRLRRRAERESEGLAPFGLRTAAVGPDAVNPRGSGGRVPQDGREG